MSELKAITLQLRDLFRMVFIENCAIDGSVMTSDESNTIETIGISEIIENLKEIIAELFAFKRECVSSEKAELINRNEQFESMLQKLEAEVRNHIRTEHQLKLHIENSQFLTNDLESEKNKHLSEIKSLQEKLKSLQNKPERKISKEFTEKIEALHEIIRKKNIVISKLQNDLAEIKNSAKCHSEESEITGKKSNKGKGEGVEEIKQRMEDKALGLQKMQILIREQSMKARKNRNREIAKSINLIEDSRPKIAFDSISGALNKPQIKPLDRPRAKSVGKRPPSR